MLILTDSGSVDNVASAGLMKLECQGVSSSGTNCTSFVGSYCAGVDCHVKSRSDSVCACLVLEGVCVDVDGVQCVNVCDVLSVDVSRDIPPEISQSMKVLCGVSGASQQMIRLHEK